MSTYDKNLGQCFYYVIELPVENVSECIQELITTETEGMGERFANGSSFAVTSDAFNIGHRRLWLSEWSRKRLEAANLLKLEITWSEN